MIETGARTDLTKAAAETFTEATIAEADTDTARKEVRTEANTGTGEARPDMEGADPTARERAQVAERGHRVARQGDQPESTAPNPNERGHDRGPAAREDREPSRASRADTQTLTQIAGTGKEVKHTPRRETALDRNAVPLNATVAVGDTRECVNLVGTPTSIERTCPGEPLQRANGTKSTTVTGDWFLI